MEDAATAEISRTQIWQWIRHGATLDSGDRVTDELVARVTGEEFARIRQEIGAARFDAGHFDRARALFVQVATRDQLEEFLTLPAYNELVLKEQVT
jgi:malate synthase